MEDFVNQLLRDKGVADNLPPETYNQLVRDLVDRASALVNRQIIESMSPEVLEKFEEILDSQPDNAGAMQSFINENVPDKEQIAARALLEFRALYLGDKA